MISFLSAKNTLRLNRVSPTAINLVRFLSSKKSDSVTTDVPPPAKLPLAESKAEANVELKDINSKSSSKQGTEKSFKQVHSKYLSFDELPKAPQSVIDQFSGKLFSQTSRNIFEGDDEEIKPEVFQYDFSMLPHDIIHQTSNSYATETWHRINGVPSFAQNPEHPLKRSITGMFDINPKLSEISDDFLWKLCPQGNMFGNAPFGGDTTFNSVKSFENKINKELEQQFSSTQGKAKELKEFETTLYSAKSFVRTKSNKGSTDTTSKSGGRKKLDRNLLKKYIKYSEDEDKSKKKN